jgi:X-Pro dipeptidyl-peptidase
MVARSWALPLAAALLFSGCLSLSGSTLPQVADPDVRKVWTMADDALSQPIFDKILFHQLPMKASDGAALDVWLYRPETPEDVKVPAIVHLSPYFGDTLPRGGGGLERILRENLTARGYAVVAAGVRGTGFSEGCFEIGGPRERQDAVELFELIATQPWSNGKVGAIGVSYDGTAPQGALIAGSPHLKTIVPIAAISEWYKYNFVKGVQINPQGYAFNTYYVALESLAPNFHALPPNFDPFETVADVRTYGTRFCDVATFVDVQRAQVQTAPTGLTDPYWEERNFTRFLDRVQPNVSALVVHGLRDFNVKTHNLLPWYQELQRHGVATKAVLGQWAHNYPGHAGINSRLDWNVTLLRWFDHWLKDVDTGIMDEPAVQIQDPKGVWREEDDFPPTRATHHRYYLGGSSLRDEPGTGTATFLDAASTPAGPGVATYVQPQPFESEFRFTGEAVAHLELRHSMPRGQIAVTVSVMNGTNVTPIAYGFHSYNIRNAPDRYDPLTPGETFRLRVPLLPTDAVVDPGSRLIVTLSGNNPTSTGPNMLPPPSGGTTTILHGANTYVDFPRIDGAPPLAPQPPLRGR